jgi:hypothetical protein
MKSSLPHLIPFLPLFCQLPIPKTRLNSIPMLPSSYSGRLASRNSTNSNDLLCPFYNAPVRTTQRTQPLYCWEGMLTAPLHNNGSYSIVACVFFAVGMCLPSSCQVMDVSSDFNIPVFGRHATLLSRVEVYRIQDLFLQLHNVTRFAEEFK